MKYAVNLIFVFLYNRISPEIVIFPNVQWFLEINPSLSFLVLCCISIYSQFEKSTIENLKHFLIQAYTKYSFQWIFQNESSWILEAVFNSGFDIQTSNFVSYRFPKSKYIQFGSFNWKYNGYVSLSPRLISLSHCCQAFFQIDPNSYKFELQQWYSKRSKTVALLLVSTVLSINL